MDPSTPIERVLARCACVLACMLGTAGPVQGQPADANKVFELVLTTTAYVEECIAVDRLLRTTCARVGNNLPDPYKEKKYCEFPATPFEARIARPWGAFKDTYRKEFQEHDETLKSMLRQGRESFDRQFARTRSDQIPMADIETLSRQLTGRCRTFENRWFASIPKLR